MKKNITKTIKDFENETGIGFCTNHRGKMTDLYSLSTSPLCNENCMKRSKIKGSICEKCFSMNMQEYMTGLREKLAINTELLTTVKLTKQQIPYINAPLCMVRFEAFGNLKNTLQVYNYFLIAKCNKHCDFALWTKNPWIIEQAMKEFNLSKPGNLVIIGSSYMINKPMKEFFQKYDFIDFIFTVYDKKYIKTNNVTVNCGGRSCKDCQKCYRGTHDSYEINEQLK